MVKSESEIPSISRRDLSIIIAVGFVSAIVGLVVVSPETPFSPIAPLLDIVNIVAMSAATGFFTFLTAGLLFSSQDSRQYIRKKKYEIGVRKAYWFRLLHTLVVTSSFTIIFTIVAFLRIFISDILNPFPIEPISMYFLVFALGAVLVGSIVMTAISSALACLTDDLRLCTILGSVSTITLATIAGWNADPVLHHYSLSRILALLSPHNIVRALAVQLTGYEFESRVEMVGSLGFVVSIDNLSVALLLFGLIAILLSFIGQEFLVQNSTRWSTLKGMIPKMEDWAASESSEKPPHLIRIRRSLRMQRGLTTLIVCILLTSLVISESTYTETVVNSGITVHYATPGLRENITVGSWIIFDVSVLPPPSGLFTLLSIYCSVETLGNISGTVSMYLGSLEMTSSEFELLNESTRIGLLSDHLNQSGGVGFGQSQYLEESSGQYVCVLKIIVDANPSQTGYVEGYIQIIQEAI